MNIETAKEYLEKEWPRMTERILRDGDSMLVSATQKATLAYAERCVAAERERIIAELEAWRDAAHYDATAEALRGAIEIVKGRDSDF